jgi:hypothetical protein
MNRSRNVERYAYFNFGPESPLALVNQQGEPTRMGKLYQEA